MSRSAYACNALLLALLIAAPCVAEDNFKSIRAARAATALVVLPGGKGYASSFCIDASGFFVTNAHVVAALSAGSNLSLVLNPGEADEKVITASAVRVDKEDDLAILKAQAPTAALTALALGSSDNLVETQQVTALGYPFGKLLSLERAGYPNVSVNVARISSMRKSKGKLELVQLDSQLNPGNSGGPVIDENGKVIAVVSSGVMAAGINFAVPVDKLTALLDKPEIAFTPPTIPQDRRHDPADLTIRTITFGKQQQPTPPDMTVEVILSTSDGAERSFAAVATSGGLPHTYTAHVVPLPPRSGPQRYPIEITFPDGSIRCSVEDVTVQLDGKPFALSRLSNVELKDGHKALTARDGNTTTGAALVIPPLKVSFGSYATTIDANKAMSLAIRMPREDDGGVTYRVLAKSHGTVLAEARGTLILPSAAAARTATPPPTTATANAKPPAAAPAPGPLPADAGEWADLISRIDLQRDTDSAEWTLHDGVLTNVPGPQRRTARLTIPVMPTGNYEFEFTFTRVNGTQDLCVLFPAAGHGAQLWLGAFTGQASSLEGPGDAKARNDLVRIINDKPQHLHLSVEPIDNKQASINVMLNGVPYLAWKGNVSLLQVNTERATRDGRTLGLAVYGSTTVQFKDLRVRALPGGAIAPYVAGQ